MNPSRILKHFCFTPESINHAGRHICYDDEENKIYHSKSDIPRLSYGHSKSTHDMPHSSYLLYRHCPHQLMENRLHRPWSIASDTPWRSSLQTVSPGRSLSTACSPAQLIGAVHIAARRRAGAAIVVGNSPQVQRQVRMTGM